MIRRTVGALFCISFSFCLESREVVCSTSGTNNMTRFLASCALFVLINYVHAKYSDCGSTDGSLNSINVTDCDSDADRCILHRNTNATIEIVFVSKTETDTVKAIVHGIVLGVEVPFALPNPDGCKDSGLTCPLKIGETYTYQTTLPVLRKYPRVTVDVKFELQDNENKDIVCGLIPSKIQ